MKKTIWDVGYPEYYSRQALEDGRYAPCETCPPEYHAAYARLQCLVEAADVLFESAYEALCDMNRVTVKPHLESRDIRIE